MFLPLLCKGKTVSGQSQRRKRKQSTPPPGRTSPRWCSCSGWHVHTPRRCQGSPCWSTCPLGVQVSTNTGVVKKRGDKKKKKRGDSHTECEVLNCWSDSQDHHQSYQRSAFYRSLSLQVTQRHVCSHTHAYYTCTHGHTHATRAHTHRHLTHAHIVHLHKTAKYSGNVTSGSS